MIAIYEMASGKPLLTDPSERPAQPAGPSGACNPPPAQLQLQLQTLAPNAAPTWRFPQPRRRGLQHVGPIRVREPA